MYSTAESNIGGYQLSTANDTDHGTTADDGELCNMAHIHQCDDLIEGRFLIDADRVGRHHLTDQLSLHAPARRRAFFDAKQFFQPVSTRRADIELGPVQEIALRNNADKRPVVVDHRQAALIGLDQ